MLILDSEQVGHLLTLQQVIDAVEESIKAYENNLALVPQRMHIDRGKNTLLCMPSWGKNSFGTKLVAVVPDNATKNIPVTNGAMLLNDGVTGAPIALINASKLTALRTGAVGAIGVKHITPPRQTSMGLIGCGVQGVHQVIFACAVRPINTVYFFDQASPKISEAINAVKKYCTEINPIACSSAKELVEKTNLIVAASTSSTPVIPNDEGLLRDKHFISIGSYKPSMQELPDAVYKLAGELVIDSEFAKAETGDIINPIKNSLIAEENVFTIGKLVTGRREVDVKKTTVFKSAGMALFDLYVAQAMYDEALRKGMGTNVDF
jgi:ornithine cyclodeaminase